MAGWRYGRSTIFETEKAGNQACATYFVKPSRTRRWPWAAPYCGGSSNLWPCRDRAGGCASNASCKPSRWDASASLRPLAHLPWRAIRRFGERRSYAIDLTPALQAAPMLDLRVACPESQQTRHSSAYPSGDRLSTRVSSPRHSDVSDRAVRQREMLHRQDTQHTKEHPVKRPVFLVKLSALGVLAGRFLPLFFTMADD